MARLEEAVGAFRESLEERTRERVPLDWAATIGAQGAALMLIAQRTDDAATAKTATQQIDVAFQTLRDGGNAVAAEYYHAELVKARGLSNKLRGRVTCPAAKNAAPVSSEPLSCAGAQPAN
jgi:hypothetical protein